MPETHKGEIAYEKRPGIFKRFCDAAKANAGKPFVFIIDEINRADLSSVFGELMYAMEYRCRKVTVPHFGPFEIPENVYLIGTMNSADKSLVTFDLALRRRFLFFKLAPDMKALREWNATNSPAIQDDHLEKLIVAAGNLNKALVGKGSNQLGLPMDYGIGQAYFMKIRDFCTQEADSENQEATVRRITPFAREQLWTYHLEPLLEEYLGAEYETGKETVKVLRETFIK